MPFLTKKMCRLGPKFYPSQQKNTLAVLCLLWTFAMCDRAQPKVVFLSMFFLNFKRTLTPVQVV